MLDINLIRKEPEDVKKGLLAKKIEEKLIDKLLLFDKSIRMFTSRIEELRHEQNIKSGKKLTEKEVALLRHRKGTIKTLEMGLKEYLAERQKILNNLPNLPAADVKVGKNESENEIIRTVGQRPKFTFKPKDYLTLAEKLDLIDLPQAAKVSGARFTYLKGQLVAMQYAIMNYAMNFLSKEGFHAMVPPLMIKDEIMRGLGYIEGIEEKEKYHLNDDKLYLIATAEQSLVPYHHDQILDSGKLPLRYFAFTPAFRREAGSYGKDTRGILRVHQFDKLEMVSFAKPEKSDQEQQYLLSLVEKLMIGLKLPYRVIKMCTGDLVFPSARTFDIESWLPVQNQYRETHSCSTCTDFQARRLNIRYKDKDQINFVHTLNSTVFAMGRILIAIMENYQTSKDTIKVPAVLQKYTSFKEIK